MTTEQESEWNDPTLEESVDEMLSVKTQLDNIIEYVNKFVIAPEINGEKPTISKKEMADLEVIMKSDFISDDAKAAMMPEYEKNKKIYGEKKSAREERLNTKALKIQIKIAHCHEDISMLSRYIEEMDNILE